MLNEARVDVGPGLVARSASFVRKCVAAPPLHRRIADALDRISARHSVVTDVLIPLRRDFGVVTPGASVIWRDMHREFARARAWSCPARGKGHNGGIGTYDQKCAEQELVL